MLTFIALRFAWMPKMISYFNLFSAEIFMTLKRIMCYRRTSKPAEISQWGKFWTIPWLVYYIATALQINTNQYPWLPDNYLFTFYQR